MSVWDRNERERAYTNLCEALTAAGEEKEQLFLARLCLLLTEKLADADAFERILAQASLENSKPMVGAAGDERS